MKSYFKWLLTLTALTTLACGLAFASNPPPGDDDDDDDDDCKTGTAADPCACPAQGQDGGGKDYEVTCSGCGGGNGGSSCGCEGDEAEGTSCSKCTESAGGAIVSVGSFYLTISLGKSRDDQCFAGQLLIKKKIPSPTLYTPQALEYSCALDTKILYKKTTDLATGVAFQLVVSLPKSDNLTYDFKTGQSTGKPSGKYFYLKDEMAMLDADGNPTTDTPVYYEFRGSNAVTMRYSAATGQALSLTTAKGRTIALDSQGLGVDIIRQEDILRQIKTPQAFTDIVIIDDFKYEIRVYAPEDCGTKSGLDGLYSPTGSPHIVWAIENPNRSDDNINAITVTKTAGGSSLEYRYAYEEASMRWSLTYPGDLLEKRLSTRQNDSGSIEIETLTVLDATGALAYKKDSYYTKYAWDKKLTKVVVDPDGAAMSETYAWYTNSAETGRYGRLKSRLEFNGSWKTYDYDTAGRKTVVVESYKDAAFNSAASLAKATYYSYVAVDAADSPVVLDARPRTVEEKILGVTVKKSYRAYKSVNGEEVIVREDCLNPSAVSGDATNRRSVWTYYPSNAGAAAAGKLKTEVHPNGKMDTYVYEYGNYHYDADPASRSFTPGTGDALRTSVTHGTVDNPDGVANKSTKTVNINDDFGNNVLDETYVYTGAGYERIDWIAKDYDQSGRVTDVYASDNTHAETTWNCCQKTAETLADGTQFTYAYDPLNRLTTKTKIGANGQPNIVTTYTYAGSDKPISETVAAGGLSLTTSRVYDKLGRLVNETATDGLVTAYAYADSDRTEIITLPGGATKITRKYLDGQIKSVTGTAVVAQYYDYGVNTDGTQWGKTSIASATSPNWTKTTTDCLERKIKVEKPTFNSSTATTQFTYNDKGQLVKMSQPGKADTLYVYDAWGNQFRSGLDINANGAIDLASMDRIKEEVVVYQKIGDDWFQSNIACAYAVDNSDSVTVTGVARQQLMGLPANVTQKSIFIDINGNQTVSWTELDRANKTVTRYMDTPDSIIDQRNIAINGLRQSSRTKTNLTYLYVYDALGRQTGVTDPRTGTSVTHYDSTTGHVDYVQDAAGSRTSYGYDPATGRQIWKENALGKRSYTGYNDREEVINVWGATEYPMEYVYDNYGRKTQMKTYRGGSGWDQPTWPTSPGEPEITTWNYQESTGLLVSKRYDDNKGPSYTYDAAGNLATRTWARTVAGAALVTTYSYDANTGELIGVDYNDSSPDIAYTYDRLGRQKTVTDAVGTRTFAYNAALRLESETITGPYDKVITRYYSDTGAIGRDIGFSIGTASDPDSDYAVSYAYDSYGRFASVIADTDIFEYGYLENSNLIHTVTFPNNISVTNTYEANRDYLTQKTNRYDATIVSQYTYQYDAIGRRINQMDYGTAFENHFKLYSYNDRSELTGATKYFGANLSDLSTPDTTYSYAYNYDIIGNRLLANDTETTANYVSNNLNQYTSITTDSQTVNLSYDDDGNMLGYGGWNYAWNDENRLVSAIKIADKKLEFAYDYMGRRISKNVCLWDSVNLQWNTAEERKFIYDGWNMIVEKVTKNMCAETREYTWGLDLSQTFQGAGGIGGLLSQKDNLGVYYTLCDGNGNINQYLDVLGQPVATYERDSFGKLILTGGIKSDFFVMGFSSKYTDNDFLVYYTYRYYTPILGKWLSRDTIEEVGFTNNLLAIRICFLTTHEELEMSDMFSSKTGEIALMYDINYHYNWTALSQSSIFYDYFQFRKEKIKNRFRASPLYLFCNNNINKVDFLGLKMDDRCKAKCMDDCIHDFFPGDPLMNSVAASACIACLAANPVLKVARCPICVTALGSSIGILLGCAIICQ